MRVDRRSERCARRERRTCAGAQVVRAWWGGSPAHHGHSSWRSSCWGTGMAFSHRTTHLALALATALGCHPYGPDLPRHPDVPIPDQRVSLQGSVISVERPRPEDTKSYVHVLIAPTDKKPVRLILGPGWYLDRQGIYFEPHQNVVAEGRAARDGESGIVVERISSGDRSYQIRDEQARPLWR
jgi:hypothetical protein